MANNQLIELFDLDQANGRLTEAEFQEMIDSYDPSFSAAPAIIGHKNDYPKSTLIPANAWVRSISRVGNKMYGIYSDVGQITAKAPAIYKEFADSVAFFKEAVAKKLYSKRSIGVSKRLKNNKLVTYLDHVGYLGAQLPAIKGMADHEFKALPNSDEFGELVFASDSGHETTEIEMATNTERTFAEMTPEEQVDFDKLLAALRELYNLETDATLANVTGAVLNEIGENEIANEQAVAIASVATTPGTSMSTWNDKVKPFLEGVVRAKREKKHDNEFAEMKENIATLAASLKQFADASQSTTVTKGTEGGSAATQTTEVTSSPVESTSVSDADATTAAQTAIQTLKDKSISLPSWEEAQNGVTLADLFTTLAKVKQGAGSALDALMSFLTLLPQVAELMDIGEIVDLENFVEDKRKERRGDTSKTPGVHIAEAVKDEDLLFTEEYAEADKYAKDHNVSFEIAVTKIRESR